MSVSDHSILSFNAGRYAGLLCAGILAGAASGSIVDLEFGPRRPRVRPLEHPNATQEQMETETDFSVFFGCSWRLESPSEVICGSGDDYRDDGPMVAGLSLLVGRRIDLVRLSERSFDLDLVFSGALTLRLFCDQFHEDNANYCLFVPEQIIVVGAKSILRVESYDEWANE